MIDWGLLKTPDIGGAFNAGLQHGQKQRREREVRGALSGLAADPQDPAAMGVLRANAPEIAFKMEDRAREARGRSLLGQVFDGGPTPATAPTPNALGAFASPNGTQTSALSFTAGASPDSAPIRMGNGSPAEPAAANSNVLPSPAPTVQSFGAPSLPAQSILPEAVAAAPPAPTELVDPSQLPPRTDGLRINRDALRQLYAVDPSSAVQVQKMVFDADAASFKRVQQNGEIMAQAAYHLSTIKNADGTPDLAGRQRELSAMGPQLAALGLTPEMIAQTDISDVGLGRYQAMGRSISDLTRDERAERQLDWNVEDDRADNARMDRSEGRSEYYRARSDRRAERNDGRAAVRFKERDKDRAALAAGLGGVRTDLSDLDY